MSRFVLITGKIGSGKSTVANLLRKKHYTVIDSDSLAKSFYSNPEIYKQVVNTLGPKCLNEDGNINFEYLRNNLFFSADEVMKEVKNYICGLVLSELFKSIDARYENNKEVVFIEAALTEYVGTCISWFDIEDVIFVHTKNDLRLERLQQRSNYESTKQFENYQLAKNMVYYKYGAMYKYMGPVKNFMLVKNNSSEEELNDQLMVLLEQKLNLMHEEKLAVYLRYLQEAPSYCHDNAWCYSFFNLGGCVNCPFPCKSQDKYYKKLNAKYVESQKKAYSAEAMYEKFIQAWADEYNQAQNESKEFYVRS